MKIAALLPFTTRTVTLTLAPLREEHRAHR